MKPAWELAVRALDANKGHFLLPSPYRLEPFSKSVLEK
jgi:hypothetical protein